MDGTSGLTSLRIYHLTGFLVDGILASRSGRAYQMAVCKVTPGTRVEVSGYKDLMAWRRSLPRQFHSWVKNWTVRKLTKAQYRRLSKELKRDLTVVAWA